MGLKVNKSCCDSCKEGKRCEGNKLVHTNADFVSADMRREVFQGQDTLVVPLVMAKADVVMNDMLLPMSEYDPIAWNGVPVTVGHPMIDEDFVSASDSPAVSSAWSVGTIFNSSVEGNKLKAEAWLNVARLQEVSPGLLERLEAGTPTDVSTGLFSDDLEKPGVLNGVNYNAIHTNVLPDHLAILPDEEGACSWEDGCGVRVNQSQAHVRVINRLMETIAMKLKLNNKPKTNERSADDDLRQMAADLISNADSPFVTEDEDSLRMMSAETLKSMRDQFAPIGNEEGEEPEANEDEEVDANEGDEEVDANEGDEEKPVANEEDEKAPMANKNKGQLMTNADREALEFARRAYSEHRDDLVTQVVANTKITEAQAKGMDTKTLEIVANGVEAPAPNYAGRASVSVNQGEQDDEAEKMFSNGVVAHLKQKKAS